MAIVTLAFILVRLAPGDPAEIWLADWATPELVASLRSKMGLDRPVLQQYFLFISQLLHGDLGQSLISRRPVLQELLQAYPYTLKLTLASLLISSSLGLVLGTLAALRRNSRLDVLIMSGAVLGIGMPGFWFGLVLLVVFSVRLGLFPITGAGDPSSLVSTIRHLILPAAASGLRQAASVIRMTRSAVLEVIGEDYVRTARAKGLAERVIVYKHMLRNALGPIVSIASIDAVILLGGSVVIENVFSRPGVGRLLVTAVSRRDYSMVQGCIFLFALTVLLINLVTDLIYAYLDPRIRYD
jgi:peptide/nickel transport system permease protein/oligopeptide transport system permease protein